MRHFRGCTKPPTAIPVASFRSTKRFSLFQLDFVGTFAEAGWVSTTSFHNIPNTQHRHQYDPYARTRNKNKQTKTYRYKNLLTLDDADTNIACKRCSIYQCRLLYFLYYKESSGSFLLTLAHQFHHQNRQSSTFKTIFKEKHPQKQSKPTQKTNISPKKGAISRV